MTPHRKPDGESVVPAIHRAALGRAGEVKKLASVTQLEAVTERQDGRDIVVCGSELATNRRLAEQIENAAHGQSRRCPPHASSGPNALPHYQPLTRPPQGHTFYETPHRKAK